MDWLRIDPEAFEAILFQAYPDPVHLVDGAGRFLRVNPSWERMSGYSRKELLGFDLPHLAVPLDVEKICAHLAASAKGESLAHQATLRRKNGTTIEVQFRHFLLPSQRPETVLFGVVQERGPQGDAEALLAFQKTLLNQARCALVAADRQGRILFWNRFAEDLYQWTADEVMGRDVTEVINPQSVTTLKQSGHWEGEVQTFRKDGTPILVHLSHSVIRDRRGRVSGTVFVATDITDRRRMEEERERLQAQLRQAQRLESIGTIASGIAHNFNNVMAAILGNSQLIQAHSSDPTVQGYAKMIDRQVLRGSSLVNHLMRFARAQRAVLTRVDLVELVNEVHDIIRRSFDKRIEIEINLPSSLEVKGDPAGLTQVLMNLCTNARDAMPEGGRLRIEAGRQGDRALVVVSDTGHGMSREILERIFDPFFTTKPPGKGTGLGLSTAYGIIEACGGEIEVESAPGKGAIFTIRLPLATKDEGLGAKGEEPLFRGNGERVLIVDDEPDLLETLAEIVRNLGYDVHTASDGEEAIERFKSVNPDLVIIDRNMPRMDGIQCAQRILELDPRARIIIASGYAESMAPGMDETTRRTIRDYITKPFRTEALSRALALALKA